MSKPPKKIYVIDLTTQEGRSKFQEDYCKYVKSIKEYYDNRFERLRDSYEEIKKQQTEKYKNLEYYIKIFTQYSNTQETFDQDHINELCFYYNIGLQIREYLNDHHLTFAGDVITYRFDIWEGLFNIT